MTPHPFPSIERRGLREEDAARYVGLSRIEFALACAQGVAPQPTGRRGSRRWRVSELAEWTAAARTTAAWRSALTAAGRVRAARPAEPA